MFFEEERKENLMSLAQVEIISYIRIGCIVVNGNKCNIHVSADSEK